MATFRQIRERNTVLFAGASAERVEGQDPSTYIVLALALAAVSMVAAWIPARRAARVEPTVALRSE
jgi:hypothetical protein